MFSGTIHCPDRASGLVAQVTTVLQKSCPGQDKECCSDLWRHRCLPVSACYAPAEHKKTGPKDRSGVALSKASFVITVGDLHTGVAQGSLEAHTTGAASGPSTPRNFSQVKFGLSRLFLFGLVLARSLHAAFLQQLF